MGPETMGPQTPAVRDCSALTRLLRAFCVSAEQEEKFDPQQEEELSTNFCQDGSNGEQAPSNNDEDLFYPLYFSGYVPLHVQGEAAHDPQPAPEPAAAAGAVE